MMTDLHNNCCLPKPAVVLLLLDGLHPPLYLDDSLHDGRVKRFVQTHFLRLSQKYLKI